MKQILHLAEPIALHMRLLGGLCTKGQREVPKAPMLEILERISGVNVNSEVGDDKALWQVALFVHRRNLMLGRPCKEVHLPVDWSQFGPFVLVEHGGGVACIRRGRAAGAAHPELNGHALADLFMDGNYSERRATILSKNDKIFRKACNVLACFFELPMCGGSAGGAGRLTSSASFSTPPQKRARNQIEFGPQALQLCDDSPAHAGPRGKLPQLALPGPAAPSSSTDQPLPGASEDLVSETGASDVLRGVPIPSASDVGMGGCGSGEGDATEGESDAGGAMPRPDPEAGFVPPPPEGEGDE